MKRRQESGFALLLIFLMAAVIAITLYTQIPRVAFDSQRQKEQLLIERGEQYKRAIQLFVKTNNRWPAKIEELESFNNRRYLRKRFIDPMTGKDEWRLVHIANGILTDSKVQKAGQGDKKEASTEGQYVGVQAGLGQTLVNQSNSGLNLAMRKRPSEGGTGDPNAGGMMPQQPGQGGTSPGVPGAPGMPGSNGTPGTPGFGGVPGMPGSPTGTGVPLPPGIGMPGGLQPNRPPMPGMPGSTGTTGSNSNGGMTGSTYVGGGGSYVGGGSYIGSSASNPSGTGTGIGVGQPGFPPGNPVNSQTGGVSPQQGSPYGTTPGSNGINGPSFPQQGTGPGQMPAQAQQLLNNILQGGGRGMPTGMQGGMAMGGGIAGVASNADSDSIMIYNDQQNYGTWEFIFDPQKIRPPFNPNSGAPANGSNGRAVTDIVKDQGNKIPTGPVGTPVTEIKQQ